MSDFLPERLYACHRCTDGAGCFTVMLCGGHPENGKKIFNKYCVKCHREDGKRLQVREQPRSKTCEGLKD
ncbi:MAG: c-type cytochrome [Candidatus Brocadia sp.]|nr:c-type cytochrome [Candidatus Brocadia sp.]